MLFFSPHACFLLSAVPDPGKLLLVTLAAYLVLLLGDFSLVRFLGISI